MRYYFHVIFIINLPFRNLRHKIFTYCDLIILETFLEHGSFIVIVTELLRAKDQEAEAQNGVMIKFL